MDLPARASFFNQVNFNGKFSCCFCKIKGEIGTDNKIQFKDSINEKRTNLEDFNEGFKDCDNAWWKKLIYFKPYHICVDIMHQLFEGLFKYILKKFIQNGIIFDLKKINKKISEIKPLSTFQKRNKKIIERKAIHYKFLLFYYYNIFENFCLNNGFELIVYLNNIYKKLYSKIIYFEDLKKIKILIIYFKKKYENLLGIVLLNFFIF